MVDMTTPVDGSQDLNHPGLDRSATSNEYLPPPFPTDAAHFEGHKIPGGDEIIKYLEAVIEENKRG